MKKRIVYATVATIAVSMLFSGCGKKESDEVNFNQAIDAAKTEAESEAPSQKPPKESSEAPADTPVDTQEQKKLP